jgi:hypothetical protein
MNSSEVLDTSLAVARNLGVQLLRVSLNPTFFCVAALVFVFGFALPQLQYTERPDSSIGQVGETVTIIALAILVGGPIFLLGATYAGSIVIQLTSNFLLGKPADVGVAETAVRNRLGTLFLCGLRELAVCFGFLLASGAILLLSGIVSGMTGPDNPLAGVLAVVGGFAFLGGCCAVLALFARRAIMFPIVVLEGAGIRDAGARMKKLMKQVRYQPTGVGVIGSMYGVTLIGFAVIYFGVFTVLSFFNVESMVRGWANHSMFEPLLGTAVQLVPVFCAIWALLPFWAVVLTVLYYERRIRVEGFDIEQLSEEIGRDGRTNRFNV